MQEAVDIAMKQHPSVRQSRAAADAAEARIDLAHVPLHPTITLSGTASTGSKLQAPCKTDPTMTCGGFFEPTASTGLAAALSWRIWDFGATAASVRAAEANAAAANAGLDTTALDIRRNVEVAYLEAVARQRLVTVSEATVKSEETHLDQAKRFVAAQAKDPIEVAQAQSRAANARSTLAQAQSGEAVALANLRSAIGWMDAATAPAIDPQWPEPSESDPPQLGVLVEDARKRRPEIVQLDKEIIAAQANVDAARAERRPVLSATARTQWEPGIDDWRPQPTWTAGLTLSWLLWDGGRSAADAKIARANMTGAVAERDALLVTLTSALEAARAEIVANRAAVDASKEAISAAQAQLKLAEARYAQGLGSQIELADAQTAVTTAQGNMIQADWQLATAWASLRRALGTR
jgi:outer membrane protein TolC